MDCAQDPLARSTATESRCWYYYFLLAFLAALAPYFLRACRSHATRLLLFVFFLQALRAFVTSCARDALTPLQPVTAIFVVCLITAPFWPVISVGIASDVLHRLKCSFSGTLDVSAECGPAGSTV